MKEIKGIIQIDLSKILVVPVVLNKGTTSGIFVDICRKNIEGLFDVFYKKNIEEIQEVTFKIFLKKEVLNNGIL